MNNRGPCLASESELPPGYKFEWQVMLDPLEDGTVCWGVYEKAYQRCLTVAYFKHGPGTRIIYQPGGTQRYEIDLNAMTQTRISCWPGWGSKRDVRCVIVPCDGWEYQNVRATLSSSLEDGTQA